MPTTTSNMAETRTVSCGPRGSAHPRLGRAVIGAGRSGSPSNRRIAASIAASRRAGRGGGGSGSKPGSCFSTAIYRVPSIPT
jgi:hypothetical protein